MRFVFQPGLSLNEMRVIRSMPFLNYFTIQGNVEMSFYIVFQLKFSVEFKKPKATKFETYMGIRNVTINLCSFLGGKMESIFIGVFTKDLRRHTNAFHPCPFSVIW